MVHTKIYNKYELLNCTSKFQWSTIFYFPYGYFKDKIIMTIAHYPTYMQQFIIMNSYYLD